MLDAASAVVANTLASRGEGDKRRVQTERLKQILDDLPAHLAETASVAGNCVSDLHPAAEVLPARSVVCGLRGMTCVIGGASRGIGQGIAVRFARSGANVCVLGRSDGMVETGPGTLSAVVEQIESVGGKGLAVQCDLRHAEQVDAAVAKVVARFGSIDIVVNNASALFPFGVEGVDESRYDLMNHVCGRGAYLLTRACVPHMRASLNPHVLTVAPGPLPDRKWLGPHVAYSSTKIVMAMLAAGWAVEFPWIRFNTIWPRYMTATYAVSNNVGANLDHTVTVAHMADPAYRIVTSRCHTQFFTDADVISMMRIRDKAVYQVDPTAELFEDFMIDPEGFRGGQRIGYTRLPPASPGAPGGGALEGRVVVLAGGSDTLAPLVAAVLAQGGKPTVVPLTQRVDAIEAALSEIDAIDCLYLEWPRHERLAAAGTPEVNCDAWESLFGGGCRAVYFYVKLCLPKLRRSVQRRPTILMEAPAPRCEPGRFVGGGVPHTIVSYIRGMYVIGIAEEFRGTNLRCNGIWASDSGVGVANILSAAAICCVMAADDAPSGEIFAEQVTQDQGLIQYPVEYSKDVHFVDFTTAWLAGLGV